jgi:RNA polymerase sigma factor (sigma-70 family)
MSVSRGLPPFQRFLDEHRDVVWRFLVSSVGPVDAEDCFQETFIAALRAYPRLRVDSNLRAWVLTIAHRKSLDAHRARARRATPVEDPAAVDGRSAVSEPGRDEALWGASARRWCCAMWPTCRTARSRRRSAARRRRRAVRCTRDCQS